MPPTASARSRLPVPMPLEMPEPAWCARLENSCMPVPVDPTMPMGPRRTALAKPMPAPHRKAVPQSGPMTMSPRSRASSLSERSSATDTLLENRNTFRPSRRAARASRAAHAPGTEITATEHAGRAATASVNDLGSGAAPGPGPEPRDNHASGSAAMAATAASSPSSASTRSPGPAPASSAPP
jgi:hypothetical protein